MKKEKYSFKFDSQLKYVSITLTKKIYLGVELPQKKKIDKNKTRDFIGLTFIHSFTK